MQAAGLRDEDWALWRAFVHVRRGIDHAVEHRLQGDAAISTAEFDVLLALSEAPDQRLRSGALADALEWEKSRISHQVRRMAERGLLLKAECPTDARGTWVVMSDAGAAALGRAVRGYAEVLRERFIDALGDGEKRAFGGMMRRVSAALEPVGSVSAATDRVPPRRPSFSQGPSTE